MTVHNHGSEDGPGLSCPERIIDGKRKGKCMDSMIPDEAVEAAGYAEMNGEVVCNFISEDLLRAALEAAAPHLFRPAATEEDQLRRIPTYANCATCDGGGCGDCV